MREHEKRTDKENEKPKRYAGGRDGEQEEEKQKEKRKDEAKRIEKVGIGRKDKTECPARSGFRATNDTCSNVNCLDVFRGCLHRETAEGFSKGC